MIAFLLAGFIWANPFCSDSASNKDFKELQKKIDGKIATSSNLVTIAKEADGVLSKLISAKSPVLLSWIEKRNLMNAKEEEIAGQWREYYLNQFILSKYPTPNPGINSSVESLFSDINDLAFDKAFRDKTESLFNKAKEDTLSFADSLDIKAEAKKAIKDKISPMKLYWFEGLKGSRYQNKPLEFIRWGVAYDPTHNEINVGVNVKEYARQQDLYTVFVHEMAHSIDPCRWSAFFKIENPFKNLISCLRGEQSAGAKVRDDSQMASMLSKNYLNQAMAQSLRENPTCNRTFYPPTGTQKDQILEVFADWMSAEVLARSSYLIQQVRTDLCQPHQLEDGSSYLSNQERLQRIYYVQPKIRALLKVQNDFKYCSL